MTTTDPGNRRRQAARRIAAEEHADVIVVDPRQTHVVIAARRSPLEPVEGQPPVLDDVRPSEE